MSKIVIELDGFGCVRVSGEPTAPGQTPVLFPTMSQAKAQAELWQRETGWTIEDRTREGWQHDSA